MTKWFKGTYKGVYTELRNGEPWVAFQDDDIPEEFYQTVFDLEIDGDQG
jgi:hypothetical protein